LKKPWPALSRKKRSWKKSWKRKWKRRRSPKRRRRKS
jgi:hypothetical protein